MTRTLEQLSTIDICWIIASLETAHSIAAAKRPDSAREIGSLVARIRQQAGLLEPQNERPA